MLLHPGSTKAAAEQLRPWELRFSDLTIERAIGQVGQPGYAVLCCVLGRAR